MIIDELFRQILIKLQDIDDKIDQRIERLEAEVERYKGEVEELGERLDRYE